MKKIIFSCVLIAFGVAVWSGNRAVASRAAVSAYETVADSVTDNEDWEAFINTLDSLDMFDYSPAQIYYMQKGQPFPLEDLDYDNFQAMLDSTNVVLSLFPDDVISKNMRSYAYFKLDDYDNSLRDALDIVCQNYHTDVSQNIIGYLSEIKPELVKSHLTAFTADFLENPDTTAVNECMSRYINILAECEENLNNMSEAYRLTKLASLLSGYPEFFNVRLSTLQLRNGTPDRAIDLLKDDTRNPDSMSVGVLHNYLLALRDSGKSKEAYKILKNYLARDLFDRDRQYLEIDYAVMLAANGEYKKALPKFTSLIDEISKEVENGEIPVYTTILPELYLRRGVIYLLTGDQAKGRADIEKSLSFSSEDNFSGIEATSCAWLGDRRKALEWFDIYGTSPSASVYAILGDTDMAISLLKRDFDNHRNAPSQVEYDINFINLRKTPQYKQLVKDFKPLDLQ